MASGPISCPCVSQLGQKAHCRLDLSQGLRVKVRLVSKPESQPALQEGAAVFTCGHISYTDRDVIDAALFRGELEPTWKELLRCVASENQSGDAEMDESVVDAAVEAFRYDHDLITAEETEQWLEARGLTMDEFGAYFSRHYWKNSLQDTVQAQAADYLSASEEMRAWLRAELILLGEFDRLATRLSWRVAGFQESKNTDVDLAAEKEQFFKRAGIDGKKLPAWLNRLGREEQWLNEMLRLEAIHNRIRTELLTPQIRQREMGTLRLPLTRLDVEMLEVESKDAASEASLCVTVDGLSMEEVAKEGRYPYRRVQLLIEDIEPDLQQTFLSVPEGSVLEPIARGDGFQLWRMIEKIEPNAEDPAIRERVDKRVLDLHFSKLVSHHIQWHGPMSYA